MSRGGVGGRGARAQHRSRGRGAGRRAAQWLARLVVLAVVFVAGLVIGRAVESAPEPGGTQSIVRTLEPLTVPPEERGQTATSP